MIATIRQILDLDVVRAGEPEVVSGAASLDDPVRWVHVSEQLEHVDLLHGGELVLTTGLLLESRPDGAAAQLRDLRAAGAAGLFIEILPGREAAEEAVRRAAAATDLPVVVLHRRVRFVEVTEQVHSAIATQRLAQVEKQRRAHEVFTRLSLDAADEQTVVRAASALLDAPVVLEDLGGRLVAHGSPADPDPGLLRRWSEVSAASPHVDRFGPTSAPGWVQAPVGDHTGPWARLLAEPQPSSDAGLAEMVLERAAQTMAINTMARRDREDLTRQAQSTCLDELRRGHLVGDDAVARLRAVGLPAASRYVPVAIRVDDDGAGSPAEMQRRARAVRDSVWPAVEGAGAGALVSIGRTDLLLVLLAVTPGTGAEAVLDRLAHGIPSTPWRRAGDAPARRGWWMGAGRARRSLDEAVRALDEAVHVADSAAGVPDLPARACYRAADVRLRGLLAALPDSVPVEAFVRSELGPLLAEDRSADLDLLEAHLAVRGNKTELARRTFMSRPTLYARLDRLEAELDVSLSDAESQLSLHVAVLLHRLARAREGRPARA